MQRCAADLLLNSKSEWYGPATVTLQAECGRWVECCPAQPATEIMEIMKVIIYVKILCLQFVKTISYFATFDETTWIGLISAKYVETSEIRKSFLLSFGAEKGSTKFKISGLTEEEETNLKQRINNLFCNLLNGLSCFTDIISYHYTFNFGKSSMSDIANCIVKWCCYTSVLFAVVF